MDNNNLTPEMIEAGNTEKEEFIRAVLGDEVADKVDDNNRDALFGSAAQISQDLNLNERLSNYYNTDKLSIQEEVDNIMECMTLMSASEEDLEESVKLHTGFNTNEAKQIIKESRKVHKKDLADKILETVGL